MGFVFWRRRRDLNPRYPFGVYTISNRARSASYATSPYRYFVCQPQPTGIYYNMVRHLSIVILKNFKNIFEGQNRVLYPAKHDSGTILSFRPQSSGLRPETEGFSHGLNKCPPDTCLPSLRSGRPFKSHFPDIKKTHTGRCGSFLWRRRRDLNPRYPFGVYTISNRARSASYATSPYVLLALTCI